jgi:hypothetical protein
MLVREGELFQEDNETPALFERWSDLADAMKKKYDNPLSGAFVSSVLGGKEPLSAKLAAQLLGIVKGIDDKDKYVEAFHKCFSMMHKKGDKFLDDVKAEILQEKKI